MLRRASIRFAVMPATGLAPRPSFEVYRLMDNPDDGHLTRVTYLKERGSVVISRFPQLGPRKEDPTDNSPQFDVARRMSARFTIPEVASFLAVLEGKSADTNVKTMSLDVTAKRTDDGFAINGTVSSGPPSDRKSNKLDVNFDNTRTTQLYHFLDSAVKDSVGFYHH
jgi:hypothetical protein